MPGPRPSTASAVEVFLRFLRLGCISFGGPIAHIGYFSNEFVLRLRWLDEATFAEIVGLCQSLPGPASSQVAFTIGLLEAGVPGAFAAWLAFTLPSALLMFALAQGHPFLTGKLGTGITHGLQLAAVAVVAQAVLGMARTLTPDLIRGLLALIAAFIVLFVNYPFSQLIAIASGAALGIVACRRTAIRHFTPFTVSLPRRASLAALVLFFFLLVAPALALAVTPSQTLAVFQAFYRTGALVFGGGHVVLPLLQAATVARGWIDPSTFLAGYGGAQALPGPLFTFAAYLGALLQPKPNGLPGAALALTAIFLPGLLLVLGVLPFWNRLRANPTAQSLLAGVNASVVGILAAALYRPLWTATVKAPADYALVFVAFLTLIVAKVRPWIVVGIIAASGAALPYLLHSAK
jgi:chromate transporter